MAEHYDKIKTGYPLDFPKILDTGGLGQGDYIKGFGGILNSDKKINRNNVNKVPVILIHGNGASATGSAFDYFLNFSWNNIRKWLKEKDYNDSEIWALSYLGEPATVQINSCLTSNINDVRSFIDAVLDYLNVDKVDIIAHSLGCALARGYLYGLQNNGTFDKNDNRFDKISTLVLLAGGNYGLTANFFNSLAPFFDGEDFVPGSPIESGLHTYEGFLDDTPYGSNNIKNQRIEGAAKESHAGLTQDDYVGISPLDNGKITYVSLWAEDDAIDIQNDQTGRLKGANLNKGYDFSKNPFLMGMDAHAKILNSKEVFQDFYPYLNNK